MIRRGLGKVEVKRLPGGPGGLRSLSSHAEEVSPIPGLGAGGVKLLESGQLSPCNATTTACFGACMRRLERSPYTATKSLGGATEDPGKQLRPNEPKKLK